MASTRAAAKKDTAKTKELAGLLNTYGAMKEACEQQYPHAPNHLLLAVLVCAGANPLLVPMDEPYDEHGYYQMDWQLGSRAKYPWPDEKTYQDVVKAVRYAAVPE